MGEDAVKRRRRGAALEDAILDAAWAELAECGYVDLAVDAVAVRAGTSKAVLYRRWPNKQELARAAIEHVLANDPITLPDTGALREDVIALLRQATDRRIGIATHLIAGLGEFYRETGTTLADLRDSVADRQESVMDRILDRAIDRGEINPDRLTRRIARLPVDLLRLELLLGSASPTDDDITEIVDTIFLPLVAPQDLERDVLSSTLSPQAPGDAIPQQPS